ncbi:uncharacterized protein pbxip1a [Anableps anableps]
MSDSSNSSGSTGSSTNSWTLLSPEEAAIENVGPADDGTESLGDAPSLSEEVAVSGAAAEYKPTDLPVETVLSEEGHQVCQETSPESSEGPIPSSPSRLSPLPSNPLDPSYLDTESQPPVIHDIMTTSPSDNEPQGAMPLVTSIDLAAQLDLPAVDILLADPTVSPPAPHMTEITASAEPVLHTPADSGPMPASPPARSDVSSTKPKVNVPTETLTATEPLPHVESEIRFGPESTEPPSPVPERLETEHGAGESPTPETVGSAETEEVMTDTEKEEEILPESLNFDEEEEEQSNSLELGDASSFDDGLRRRNVPSFEAPRPRTSDEEDDEEEAEFKMAEKREEKPWFSMNKCMVAALVLLFLGSLFLSGDIDSPELSDGDQKQKQDWLSCYPQEMKELLDQLTEESQYIAQLEAHLQAHLQTKKKELNLEMMAVAENANEQDKAYLGEEKLSVLPELRKEMESLLARASELSQLPGMVLSASSSASQPDAKDAQSSFKAAEPEWEKDGKLMEELHRQKILLDESRKRLEGMKKDENYGKQVWDGLDRIQTKLSEQVERWVKTKPQGPKWKGNKDNKQERDHWKKEEKKEWKNGKEEKKEWKHGKEEKKEWKHGKEEKKEKEGKHGKEEKKEKEGKHGKEEKKEKEWKPQKENSHKEAWRKHQNEWQRKKGERRMDREERRKEKPWHSRPGKNSHHQQPRQPHQHHHNDFWRDQELKLHRNVRPQLGCTSVEDCATKEGLYPVELPEFEELLEGYLSKLEGSSNESKDKIRKLTADFFEDGVFIHDRVRFGDFAEDVADVLEDMVDVLDNSRRKDNDPLEEEMEEFEREALWKFAATA